MDANVILQKVLLLQLLLVTLYRTSLSSNVPSVTGGKEKALNVQRSSCGGEIQLPNDYFYEKYLTSPQYPGEYPNDAKCVWILRAPLGNAIHVKVVELNLEAGSDYLEIYDGDINENAMKNLAKLSGFGGKSLEYITDQNTATVMFTSDASGSDFGFLIRYNLFPVTFECSEAPLVLNSPEGYVKTPLDPYNDALHECQWLITVDKTKVVEVTLERFLSTYDILNITFYDGPSTANKILATTSHTELYTSFTITAKSYQMLVRVSDSQDAYVMQYAFRYASVDFSQTTVCGAHGTFTQAPGMILSPQYPNYYPPDSSCQWLVQAPENSHVMVVVDTFRVTKGDLVVFHDGGSNDAIILKQCSYMQCFKGDVISTSSNELFISFDGSQKTTESYFKFKYFFPRGAGCDSTVYESDRDSGIVQSPSYPGNYPNSYQCEYTVTVSSGDTIEFYFSDFSTEPNDILTIYDGSSTSSTIIAQLSGNKKRYFGTTSGNTMLLSFVTDGSDTNSGFSMNYNTPVPNVPTSFAYSTAEIHEFESENIVLAPGNPYSYPDGFDFVWYFNSSVDAEHIHFDFYRIDLDSTDFIKIYNGLGVDPSNLRFILPNFEDAYHPYASGKEGTIWFHSSSSFSGKGFFMKYYSGL